jgi:cysteine desulfurase
MKKNRIYLDHNATTPLHPNITLTKLFGNPSSHHQEGQEAKEAIEHARYALGKLIGASPKNILWVPNGTTANNIVLKNVLTQMPAHIITSAAEHPSVIETCRYLEKNAVDVTYLEKTITPEKIKTAIRPNTKLISIMYANNETGDINPIADIAKIAKKHNIPLHTDAVQAMGKIVVNTTELDVDYLSLSGHKFNAPKGIGALYAKNLKNVFPLIHGGPQEQQRQAGTENLPGIIGLGIAAEAHIDKQSENHLHLKTLRDTLLRGLDSLETHTNTNLANALPNTLNISFLGVNAESLAIRLDLEGIAVSTGSACSTGTTHASSALTSMKLEKDIINSAIRFSIGISNTLEEIERTIETLKKIIPLLKHSR